MSNLVYIKDMKSLPYSRGLTLVELLVVIVILGILTLFVAFSATDERLKARDATRKGDIERIKIALYEYYFDNGCFPRETPINQNDYPLICGAALEGSEEPYLDPIPCDPNGNPYIYQTPPGSCPQMFRVLTDLENLNDPSISQVGCGIEEGQGCGEGCEYNYGTSSTNLKLEKGCNNYWICSPGGACERYEDPFISECPLYSLDQEDVCGFCGKGSNRNKCKNASGKGNNQYY